MYLEKRVPFSHNYLSQMPARGVTVDPCMCGSGPVIAKVIMLIVMHCSCSHSGQTCSTLFIMLCECNGVLYILRICRVMWVRKFVHF